MDKEIEKSILYVVHKIRFTANQLAIINTLYNAPNPGLTLPELTSKINEKKSGKKVSGILSQLAQAIDKLEKPGKKYEFTGYLLFFERSTEDLHIIRPEFRHVIDIHPTLKHAMQIPVEQIYVDYQNGLDLKKEGEITWQYSILCAVISFYSRSESEKLCQKVHPLLSHELYQILNSKVIGWL